MLADIVKRLTTRARLLAIGTLLALAWGCGSYEPMRPSALSPSLLPPPPEPMLQGSSPRLVPDDPPPSGGDGTTVCAGTVPPDQPKTVKGGRYELLFQTGSVTEATDVRVVEPDSSRLLFELEPHGVQFQVPVVLEVDYSGTNADPDSPNYDGSLPVLYWFDDKARAWVEVRGVTDVGEKLHIVQLSHFSTYTLAGRHKVGGKGGW